MDEQKGISSIKKSKKDDSVKLLIVSVGGGKKVKSPEQTKASKSSKFKDSRTKSKSKKSKSRSKDSGSVKPTPASLFAVSMPQQDIIPTGIIPEVGAQQTVLLGDDPRPTPGMPLQDEHREDLELLSASCMNSPSFRAYSDIASSVLSGTSLKVSYPESQGDLDLTRVSMPSRFGTVIVTKADVASRQTDVCIDLDTPCVDLTSNTPGPDKAPDDLICC